MVDNLKPEDRRKTMQSVKGKKTNPERRLFAILTRMHLKGWRQNFTEIPGKPDVVFMNQKVAIFLDGCFWHGCPTCQRELPKTNQDYWKRKIARNIELAKFYNEQLKFEGWTVIRIWEHEILNIEKRKQIKQMIQRALSLESNKNEF